MSPKAPAVALVGAVALLAGCQRDETPPAPSATPPVTASVPTFNGVAALAPDQILRRSKDALKDVQSFRATGTVKNGDKAIAVDFGVRGTDFAGSFAVDDKAVRLLAVGGKHYVGPSEKVRNTKEGSKKAKPTGTARLRWVTVADNDKKGLALFRLGNVNDLLELPKPVTKGREEMIGDVPAITLIDGESDQRLYVAKTGEPYPLRWIDADGSALTFSAFGEPIAGLEPPPADEVIDVARIASR
ncbi:hypothetical protein [Krasilnikovia sp. MM14-A1004]|uniref:hypothetical protein n=1 Tax=Krasilnikovia sp. MM14-A1004 TaxID=3373541 RepID=UPI00399D55FC